MKKAFTKNVSKLTRPYNINNNIITEMKLARKKEHLEFQILLENNKKWSKKILETDPNFFLDLSKGQTPNYLFIGCSDSRVPAEQITGL